MATLRKLRPVLLCALPLVAACASMAADSVPAQSWFDKEVEQKIHLLRNNIHASDARRTMISVGLVEEISDLRDRVTDANQINSLLQEVISDGLVQGAVREEARDLQVTGQATRRDTVNSACSDNRVKALLESVVASAAEPDIDLRRTVEYIKLHHGWLSYEDAVQL